MQEGGSRFEKAKNDDRGVTLVEIIVSIAILAIIVLPFECICHSYKDQCKG
ncbi:MAG: type II secretion system protein [Agathobacter rectalis]